MCPPACPALHLLLLHSSSLLSLLLRTPPGPSLQTALPAVQLTPCWHRLRFPTAPNCAGGGGADQGWHTAGDMPGRNKGNPLGAGRGRGGGAMKGGVYRLTNKLWLLRARIKKKSKRHQPEFIKKSERCQPKGEHCSFHLVLDARLGVSPQSQVKMLPSYLRASQLSPHNCGLIVKCYSSPSH